MEPPSEYAEVWKQRYDELTGHGVPAERARELASELAAAAVLASVRSRGEPPVQQVAAPAAPAPVPLRIAKLDGLGLLVMGVPSALFGIISASAVGTVIGVVVTLCGWAELDGHRRYTQLRPGSRLRLVGSQVTLVVVAWVYAGWTLIHPEPLSPEITDLLKESGEQTADIMGLVNHLRYIVAGAICLVTLLYQGGLAVYYASKTRGLD